MSLVLGLIGTAGRGEDGKRLTVGHWNVMCAVGQTVAKLVGADRVVSGGAAFADHTAVRLYLKGLVPNLTLHLAAPFDRERACYANTDCGRTSNRYHSLFAPLVNLQQAPEWTLYEIAKAIEKGATVTEEDGPGFGPFFKRNAKVAADADVMLAFTFGQPGQPALKDGGSSNTMDTFLKRRGQPYHPLYPMLDGRGIDMTAHFEARAYHFNLTDQILYSI